MNTKELAERICSDIGGELRRGNQHYEVHFMGSPSRGRIVVHDDGNVILSGCDAWHYGRLRQLLLYYYRKEES